MLALLSAEAVASTATTTRIIVKRDPGLGPAARADIRADAGVRHVQALPLPRTEIVAARRGDAAGALRELNADPRVVYAELDHIRRAAAPPNDPYFDRLWALDNRGQPTPGFHPDPWIAGTADADMDVLEAWDRSRGSGQLVAVVDSGVDTTHGDLAENLAPGYDWVDKDGDPLDATGHGTRIAGTIAARRGNGIGVAGVAPEARVLPLRVLGADNAGRVSDIVSAFDFAGEAGVRVVNASFASGRYSQAEHDAIAGHPSTLFVVAAGNLGEGAAPEYPCAYPAPNLICVGASDADDQIADFSSRGAPAVDLFAPGDRIYTTFPANGYGLVSGTSIAAPHVAGEAALILARNPGLDVPALRAAVLDTGDDVFTEPETRRRANALTALESVPADRDGDGVADPEDNCVSVPNPGQENRDGDAIGDACDMPDPDSDGDGIGGVDDACPYDPGASEADGCPGTARDGDADGILDIFDNCDTVDNADQRDVPDGDGIGDACDPDRDGDGRANTGDRCPDVYAQTADGCPAPAPTPPPPNRDGDDRPDAFDACPAEWAISNDGCPLAQISSLSGKVRKRGRKRSVTVKVETTRLATLRVTIERKRRRGWARVKRGTFATVANRARVGAKRLRPGRYRVRVSVWSGAGAGSPVTKRFRVR